MVKEFAYFVDGSGGYAIGEGEGSLVYRAVSTFSPFVQFEVREVISCEAAKEILRSLWKAQAEAAKKK